MRGDSGIQDRRGLERFRGVASPISRHTAIRSETPRPFRPDRPAALGTATRRSPHLGCDRTAPQSAAGPGSAASRSARGHASHLGSHPRLSTSACPQAPFARRGREPRRDPGREAAPPRPTPLEFPRPSSLHPFEYTPRCDSPRSVQSRRRASGVLATGASRSGFGDVKTKCRSSVPECFSLSKEERVLFCYRAPHSCSPRPRAAQRVWVCTAALAGSEAAPRATANAALRKAGGATAHHRAAPSVRKQDRDGAPLGGPFALIEPTATAPGPSRGRSSRRRGCRERRPRAARDRLLRAG